MILSHVLNWIQALCIGLQGVLPVGNSCQQVLGNLQAQIFRMEIPHLELSEDFQVEDFQVVVFDVLLFAAEVFQADIFDPVLFGAQHFRYEE